LAPLLSDLWQGNSSWQRAHGAAKTIQLMAMTQKRGKDRSNKDLQSLWKMNLQWCKTSHEAPPFKVTLPSNSDKQRTTLLTSRVVQIQTIAGSLFIIHCVAIKSWNIIGSKQSRVIYFNIQWDYSELLETKETYCLIWVKRKKLN
jgi:hypothetical protein